MRAVSRRHISACAATASDKDINPLPAGPEGPRGPGLCVPLSDDPGVVPSREAAGAALSGWPAVGVRREGYCSSMPPLLTGRTVRVLIGTECKNLVTRDVSEVKVTSEVFAGDNHEGLTRPADVRVKWFPRGVPIRNTRQVSLVSTEELALIAGALELPQVQAAWLGANLDWPASPGSRSCRRARASSSPRTPPWWWKGRMSRASGRARVSMPTTRSARSWPATS